MRKMEAAAMKAYMNDIEGNSDLTSQNINETLLKTNSQLVLGASYTDSSSNSGPSSNKNEPKNKNNKKNNKNKKKSGNKDSNNIKEVSSLDNKLWYEAKTEDGNIYYWHIQTNGNELILRSYKISQNCQ